MGFGLPGTDNRRSPAVDVTAAVNGGGGGAVGGEGGLTQVLAGLEDFIPTKYMTFLKIFI